MNGKSRTMKYMTIALLLIAMLLQIFTVPAQAATAYGNVGYHCTKKHTSSGNLIIGDSRTCQLWNINNTGSSFVSVWGGHYGYGGSKGQIDTSNQKSIMKEYAQATIEKTGQCNIYIFATVNDYDGGSSYKSPANNVYNLATTAYGWTAKYNKKTVHPTVYVMSLVGSKGKSVSKYNSYLKEKVSNTDKIKKFINISGCLDGSNSGYLKDNVHYNNTTLKNIWKKIQ